MFTDWIRKVTKWFVVPIAVALGKLGVSPNVLTVTGFVLNIGVAYVLALGRFRLAGVLTLAVAGFDALDGTLARETRRASRFGAFLDSVMDRLSEATIYAGLLVYYMSKGANREVFLIYIGIIGSLLVSYARARAEGVGVECKVGLLTRVERAIVLVTALILGIVPVALWVLAILANVTAFQRIWHVWQVTRGVGPEEPEKRKAPEPGKTTADDRLDGEPTH